MNTEYKGEVLLEVGQVVDIYRDDDKSGFPRTYTSGFFFDKGVVKCINSKNGAGYEIKFLTVSDGWWLYTFENGQATGTPYYIHNYEQYRFINTLKPNIKETFRGVIENI